MSHTAANKFLLIIFLFFISRFWNESFAQGTPYCDKAKALVDLLNNTHYAPPQLNDSLSGTIFKTIFDFLDPKGLYFTQAEIENLNNFRYKLDDEFQNNDCLFIQELAKTYKSCLIKADSINQSFFGASLRFDEKDSIQVFFLKKTSFAENAQSLHNRWKKHLKYKTLQYLETELDTSTLIDPILLKKDVPKALQLSIQKEHCNIQKILDNEGGLENFVASNLFNAITTSYDPHSSYFSLQEQREFYSSLSKNTYSYGLGISEDKTGNIVINQLIPGGPAWHSNQLHEGDLLLKVKQADKTIADFTCLSASEVEKLLNSLPTDPTLFTVRKKDGRTVSVRLTKEKLEVEDNIVNGFVLMSDKKIGYLSLPGFYTDWNNDNPLGCANDVAKEILKLKKERIEGLILDLRFNGGGSTVEALNLAGIFIDHGPLGLMAHRGKEPLILKDMNRGTVYNGPLLVLVNGFSASASELIAAVLQDYNRAVIVGSTTYGKASAQDVIAFDAGQAVPLNKREAKEFVKVTTGKLYRITGTSHQLNGVLPDIHLPDILENIPFRESRHSSALPSDKIQKKVYYTKLPPLKLKEVIAQSKLRVAVQPEFKAIIEASEELEEISANGKIIPLDFTSFIAQLNLPSLDSTDAPIQLSPPPFKVTNTLPSQEIMQMDKQKSLFNKKMAEQISNDIYVEEAFYILNDLISINQK